MATYFDSAGEWREPTRPLAEVKAHNLVLAGEAELKATDECAVCGAPFNRLPKLPCVCRVCRAMLDALKHNVLIIIAESYTSLHTKEFHPDLESDEDVE